MTLLLAALLAPLLGPVLYGIFHGDPRAVGFVDGFVYVAVPVLVAVQVLPIAWQAGSVWPLVAVGAGLLVPVAMERASHALEHRTDALALLAGLFGLILHALLEGSAFAPGAASQLGLAFAFAVILHRVPVGLVIWWLLRPRYGWAAAAGGVGALVIAPLVGYGIGGELLGEMHGAGVDNFQAFVSGSLMHVVFHQGRHDHQHGPSQ